VGEVGLALLAERKNALVIATRLSWSPGKGPATATGGGVQVPAYATKNKTSLS